VKQSEGETEDFPQSGVEVKNDLRFTRSLIRLHGVVLKHKDNLHFNIQMDTHHLPIMPSFVAFLAKNPQKSNCISVSPALFHFFHISIQQLHPRNPVVV
jgi:hypothetical protein